ncbi:dual specificity testis-specific protein kinase 1-like [Saccoglossus kowalevskii]|uniref:Dual specificity testis-specific protein kinase 1-like n=1 Tax=Saccoglossus kowalevskii TaxID=10224 RepID=A0ABM0N1E2_SACKO|nr:PREDICTED: dual specificity testis-specific protein kinase 1-like [Saccoglossus kowalevskii]
MAPECLKGLKYNERADLFSYGIILCETIARIPADPDVLPRLENFGVDRDTFTLLCGDCPNEFLHVAFKCCEIDPLDRLPFTEIVDQINDILTALKHDISHGMSPDEEVEALISQEVVKGHKRAKSESGTPSPPLPPPPPLPARSPVLHAGLSRCSSEKSTSGLLCATPGGVRCNPFINTPFGRNKLISTSDNSSVFEMSPSTPPSSPVFPHEVLATLAEVHRQRRKSRSLPTSPELQRRSITNSTSSDESMLSWSLSYSCRGSKSSMSSGLLGLSNKDKMSDVIPKDSHKTHDIHIGSRRLDSGLSSLYDEDLEHASEIGNVSISKVREKLEESLSINPLNSSYSSTCSSSLSARYSQDIDGLPSNWDEKDDGDEASSKKERN